MGRPKLSAKKVRAGAVIKFTRTNPKTKAKEQVTIKKRGTYSKKRSLSLDSNDNDEKSRSPKGKVVQRMWNQIKNRSLQYEEGSTSESSEEEQEEETLAPPPNKIKREYPCFACDKVFNKTQDLFDHTCKGKKEKGFMCKVCKKFSKNWPIYLSHQITHSRVKQYKCGECGKKSVRRNQHTNHMEKEHPELQPFMCNYFPCDCGFSTQKELVSHHKMIHNANQCKYCDKKFNTKKHLLRHKFNEHERFFKKNVI